MHYTREQHKRFLDKELQQIGEDYLKILNTEAITLLANNDAYVAQFVKVDLAIQTHEDGIESYDGSGQLLLKFLGSKGIPRKQEYFVAVILDQEMSLPRNWENISWGKLRNHQVCFSEVHCVWQGKADEKGFLLCGFHGLSLDMARYLIDNNLSGYTIVLGPQEPPLEYYQNLITIVSSKNQDLPIGKILDYEDSEHKWNPTPITSKEQPAKVISGKLKCADEIIVQGPPGTGKTYMMANIVADLLDANKSVLVTALANRALIELALKESLAKHLESGNIFKTNISSDELHSCKHLVPIASKVAFCSAGKLTLTTFYNSSGWATAFAVEQPFDYVIMDEASQSLFAMTAACKLLGKKVVWIGDQKQLPPVVSLKEETIIRNDYSNLVKGFQTLCDNFDYPSYVLTDTFRLQPRAAELTNVFYDVPLVSVSTTKLIATALPFINKRGGTSIVEIEMPNGEKANKKSCDYIVDMATAILSESPKLSISILSKFRSSVRMLQNSFISRFGSKENVLIDTVERVQGMTCDICIYYIPHTLENLSLNKELFNVVTSRAKQYTIIVADKSLLRQNMPEEVRKYLLKAQEDKFATFEPQKITAGNIGVTVTGKIDLSQFERKRKEIVDGKENIYIIDTNVFVNCPDIISRIGNKYKIVIPAKVLEELDKLKLKADIDKKNLNEAAKNINTAFVKHYSQMEEANLSLLPKGFDRHNPDCMILSVALKYKNENPILLTSDYMLQSRASGLGITTISLNEFLN